jgi:DNA-binding CsgD family transcriptional regulator
MKHSPGFYKRLTLLALQRDLTRVAIALLILFAILLGHAPLALVLTIPLLVYLGLWLLIPSAPDRSVLDARNSKRRPDESDILQDVIAARDGIADAAHQVPQSISPEKVQGIADWIDRSLGVIAEDKKTETLVPLLELATFTNDLLTRYLKLCRRGLANTDTHEQMKQNLTVIEDRFKWFWDQLNRDAIIDLAALSAAIDLFMETVPPAAELSLSTDDSGLSADGDSLSVGHREKSPTLNGYIRPANGASASSNGREQVLLATLTPKELEVLQHLAGGRTNQQIADSMFISKHTVAKHVENLCGKLEVQNRTEAAALAVRNGIVPPTQFPGFSDDEPAKSA